MTAADQCQRVRAITNLSNALGMSDEWTSSAVTMRGSINAAVFSAKNDGTTVATPCSYPGCKYTLTSMAGRGATYAKLT